MGSPPSRLSTRRPARLAARRSAGFSEKYADLRPRTDTRRMHCLHCGYRLIGLEAGPCPECGRRFDPAVPSSFDSKRPWPQGLAGIGLAILVAGVAFVGFLLVVPLRGLESRFVAFWLVAGIGLTAGIAAAVLAGWNRSWLGRVPLLLVGTVVGWAGLFLGHDKYYRVWQAMPNPPDAAYSDAGPVGTMVAGWIPGGLLVIAVFIPSWLLFASRRKRRCLPATTNESEAPATAT